MGSSLDFPETGEILWTGYEENETELVSGPGEIVLEPIGLKRFERFNNPETLALHTFMTIVVCSRYARAAIETGQDITVIGRKSQDLMEDVATAIAADQKRAGYSLVRNQFVTSGVEQSNNNYFIQEVVVAINRHISRFQETTFEERRVFWLNIKYALGYLTRVSDLSINQLIHEHPLPCEGGNEDEWDMELLHDFCDPEDLSRIFAEIKKGSHDSGLEAEVVIRLVGQARAFDIPGAAQLTLQ